MAAELKPTLQIILIVIAHFIRGGVIATLWAPVQPVQERADPMGGHGDQVA
jgi:hypothetical protein